MALGIKRRIDIQMHPLKEIGVDSAWPVGLKEKQQSVEGGFTTYVHIQFTKAISEPLSKELLNDGFWDG